MLRRDVIDGDALGHTSDEAAEEAPADGDDLLKEFEGGDLEDHRPAKKNGVARQVPRTRKAWLPIMTANVVQ